MKKLRHRLAHWFGWYSGRVVTWRTPTGRAMVGFKCDCCAKVSGIHPLNTKLPGEK